MPSVKIQSSDLQIFNVDVQSAKFLTPVKDSIEFLGDEDVHSQPIKLEEINSLTLKKIIDWCDYHKDDPVREVPSQDKLTTSMKHLCEWDLQYLDVEPRLLLDLARAADFLGIERLRYLVLKKIAEVLPKKKSDEKSIKKIFGLQECNGRVESLTMKLFNDFLSW